MDKLTNTVITAGTALQIFLAIQSSGLVAEANSKLDKCISDAAQQIFQPDETESPCLELEEELSRRTLELRLYSALTVFFSVLIGKSIYDGC